MRPAMGSGGAAPEEQQREFASAARAHERQRSVRWGPGAQRPRRNSVIPDVPGVLSTDEVLASAEHLASLQVRSGMIPWHRGGHCDPWNHVEAAMALDVAGLHGEAEAAYEWLAGMQRDDGGWHNYYWPDGTVEE